MKSIFVIIAVFLLFASAAFGQNSTDGWPKAKFQFEVEYTIDGKTSKLEVQEVSGLDTEAQPIEYRAEVAIDPAAQKMPGMSKFTEVTLKNGIFAKDNTFAVWWGAIRQNNIKRGTVVIRLLDEDGKAAMVWTLKNAFPNKIAGINEGASSFETIVLRYEGVKLEQP